VGDADGPVEYASRITARMWDRSSSQRHDVVLRARELLVGETPVSALMRAACANAYDEIAVTSVRVPQPLQCEIQQHMFGNIFNRSSARFV
jgi:hypothetical protein